MEQYLNTGIIVLLGAVTPIVVSALKQVEWPDQVKSLLTLGISLLFGALAVFMTDGFPTDWTTLVAKLSVIFTIATAIYQLYFKKTVLNHTLTEARLLGGKAPNKKPEKKLLVEDLAVNTEEVVYDVYEDRVEERQKAS